MLEFPAPRRETALAFEFVSSLKRQHRLLPERKEALDKWGRYLTGLVDFPLSVSKNDTRENSGEIGFQPVSGTRS